LGGVGEILKRKPRKVLEKKKKKGLYVSNQFVGQRDSNPPFIVNGRREEVPERGRSTRGFLEALEEG